MANWSSHQISEVIAEIDEKKYVLPVIQRRLVWDEEKMELLFDTLLKGDSFGGIMVLKEEKGTKPLFNYRYFTKNGENEKSMETDRLPQTQCFVIDGQQRLQSFYIGLHGSINGKILYFDLYSNYKKEFEFKFEAEFKKLPTKAKQDSEKNIDEYKWISATSLLQKLKLANGNDRTVSRQIIAEDKITDSEQKTHIEENVGTFCANIISGKCLGISEVGVDKTLNDESTNRQKIVELFRRLNDGGTSLSAFDLVASILKGFDWKMEGFLESALQDFQQIGLTQDNLIKLLFILQDDYKKEMVDIESSDADFAILNRDRIIASLNALKFFLEHARLTNYYKDKNRSFVPLFFIAYHIFHKKTKTDDLANYFDNYDAGNIDYPRIKNWLYHSLVNGVFRSKGAGWTPYTTGIRKLLDQMKTFKDQPFPHDKLFAVYDTHPIQFTNIYSSANLDSLDKSFLYYLIYDRTSIVRVQDIDHIMPKSLLELLNFASTKINSIKNYQLIDFSTNRGEKNAKAFADWINDPNCVRDKNGFCKTHLIPTDESLWLESKFDEFTEARAQLLLKKIAVHCN